MLRLSGSDQTTSTVERGFHSSDLNLRCITMLLEFPDGFPRGLHSRRFGIRFMQTPGMIDGSADRTLFSLLQRGSQFLRVVIDGRLNEFQLTTCGPKCDYGCGQR